LVVNPSSNPQETKAERQPRVRYKMAAIAVVCALMACTLGAMAKPMPMAKPMDIEAINPLQLSTFQGYQYDYNLGANGAYKFHYSLPDSHRAEERAENGDVRGSYSFVAPEGDEFDFKYQADRGGFKVQSNALPEVPEDTDEVRRAKEEFFRAYNKALDLASEDDDDEDEESYEGSEEESDESSEESSEEDDDEESSEEDDDEESSEESSEESDENDDDEESDEDDEKPKSNSSRDRYGLINQIRRSQPQKPVYQKHARALSTKKPASAKSTAAATLPPKTLPRKTLPPKARSQKPRRARGGKRTAREQAHYRARN